MVLVTEIPGSTSLHVNAISTEDGEFFEQTEFVYHPQTGMVDGSVMRQMAYGSPFLQSEIKKAHNVYMSRGAITGTVKRQNEPVPAGEQSWIPRTEFDSALNAQPIGRSQPTHKDILDIINARAR